MTALGWDVDGVLADFNLAFRRLIKAQTGIEVTEHPTGWDYHLEAGVTKEQSDALWKTITSSRRFYSDLMPLPGAPETIENLQRLADVGIPTYFITSRRGKEAHAQTVRWLQSFGMHAPQVLLAHTPLQKALTAKGLELSMFVDDRPENVWAMEAVNVPNVFLFDQSYNRGAKFKRKTRRVQSPLEVLDHITQKESLIV